MQIQMRQSPWLLVYIFCCHAVLENNNFRRSTAVSPNFNTVLVGTLPISEQKMSSSRLACTSDDSCNKKRIIHDYMHVAIQVH